MNVMANVAFPWLLNPLGTKRLPADSPFGVFSSKMEGLSPLLLESTVIWENSQSEHCEASWPSSETKTTVGLSL